jgi:hypothetical protein
MNDRNSVFINPTRVGFSFADSKEFNRLCKEGEIFRKNQERLKKIKLLYGNKYIDF